MVVVYVIVLNCLFYTIEEVHKLSFNVSPYSMNCLLRLLGPLAHGLDQLLHGGAGDESTHDPATLLKPHPDNLNVSIMVKKGLY